jgi:endoglucanase
VFGCVHSASPASAAGTPNWAAKSSVDFDADHLTDFGSLYRGRSPQDGLWYAPSSAGTGSFQIYFGATTDIPVPGDYDGDGKTDAAIFRPSTGLWYGPRTGAPSIVIQMMLGQSGDVPVPGDYDGDGKTDPAIYRPSTGLLFAVLSGGGTLGTMVGQAGDVPVPADYNGDGKTDAAVYRPTSGAWIAQLSGGGSYQATNGTATDVPVPADYNGDGRADPVVFRASTGSWTGPYNGASGTYQVTLGQAGDVPIPGYYDGNLAADPAIFRPSTGTWLATLSGGGSKRFDALGLATDVPIQERPGLALAPVAPANTALPTVSGIAQVGQTLTATSGSWSGTTPMTYAYQWRRCDSAGANCANISGATATTYTLAAADQGMTVRMRVTASNSAGSASANSAATGVVQGSGGGGGGTSGLHVSGNQLLDASGKVVRFHGVNRSGPEFACIQGWGIFDGPVDDASVTALKSWNVNAVHIGLNEDCILGINGVQAAYSGSNYMNAIVAYVNKLHAAGMYTEISLMWAAPGSQQALDHPAILDADHSGNALKAIANAFKNDPSTIIGLQSEPHAITWACWKNGGSSCSVGYTALGMQGALDAVRSTGATNVVTASGIDYANNLSQWLTYKPTDSLNQLVAEAHVYGGNSCASTACFNSDYAPVAAQVPLQFGETGETYDASSCGSSNVSTFMNWADAHGVGYQAWVWETWGNCSSLISNYNGTPANTYATWVKNHYATLP